MIDGAPVVIYSRNAEADRAFFRHVLKFACVDAGHGWLIFAIPERSEIKECEGLRGWRAGLGKASNDKPSRRRQLGICEPKHPSPLQQ